MISEATATGNLSRHLRILGICWILYGVIRLLVGLWLLSFTNTATVMFGALLGRVRDPFSMMTDFHFVYSLAIVCSFACGFIGILAGLALLAAQRFGRTMALIASFLSLSDIPLGTTLGIYSLIVLLPASTGHSSAIDPEIQATNLRRQPIST